MTDTVETIGRKLFRGSACKFSAREKPFAKCFVRIRFVDDRPESANEIFGLIITRWILGRYEFYDLVTRTIDFFFFFFFRFEYKSTAYSFRRGIFKRCILVVTNSSESLNAKKYYLREDTPRSRSCHFYRQRRHLKPIILHNFYREFYNPIFYATTLSVSSLVCSLLRRATDNN